MTPRKPSDLKVEARGSLHPGFGYSKLKDTPIFKCPNKATESVWDQRRVDWLGPALPSDNKNALHQGHWAVFSGQHSVSHQSLRSFWLQLKVNRALSSSVSGEK